MRTEAQRLLSASTKRARSQGITWTTTAIGTALCATPREPSYCSTRRGVRTHARLASIMRERLRAPIANGRTFGFVRDPDGKFTSFDPGANTFPHSINNKG